MNTCIDCGRLNNDVSAEVCPSCGGRLSSTDPLSVADDKLDELVQQASKPNLASLFGKAKAAGHIKAAYSYGGPVS
jgi:predicted  nucleic acid-binding Zn-ribbon protein